MTTTAESSRRLWVGPLLLILIIALIYVFSLMPASPHHNIDYDGQLSQSNFEAAGRKAEIRFITICRHNGFLNETDGSCVCDDRRYTGRYCEIPVCYNNGTYSQLNRQCNCPWPYEGQHCNFMCHEKANITDRDVSGKFCKCVNLCESDPCVYGFMVHGKCRCHPGFTGDSCELCNHHETYDCGNSYINKKRAAVNSRLTLRGLSFCMITIGLLCVSARRRRTAAFTPPNETWYRLFRTGRCTQEFICGRTLILREDRRRTPRHTVQRFVPTPATPPPSYISINMTGQTEDGAPPSYEEATRVLMEHANSNDEEEEQKSDEETVQIHQSQQPEVKETDEESKDDIAEE
ncbi:hypothetical protein WR25_08983 [Diploscapter pachys]|uniref:EGF-like domain-containing protein n=1 Tax=Diploscapter pachys TaxID=2018661 RepID=A0A2A2M1E8_9BILA|nr:hypothetical protein WR25_08983 [Diploscapter pachys]